MERKHLSLLPQKKVRELKRYGITEDMDIKQAYLKVSNIKNI